ncbi:MAG: glycoside hydrolase family 95 protein [Clostridia bacterium]|nr:glycoside hydrolase family 95 protein [Clostridia bacterium]
MENKLYYKYEASHFEEALPVGNGHFGGMVYSKCGVERISLNEDTVWSGTKRENYVPENPQKALKEAQKLVLEDKIFEAQEVLADGFNSMWSQMYLPMGDLFLSFGHKNVSEYRRELDFTTGIVKTEYMCDNVKYTREVFASYPDDVMVVRVCANSDKALNFTVKTETKLKIEESYNRDNILLIKGVCPSIGSSYSFVQPEPHIYDDKNPGVRFAFSAKVTSDGEIVDLGDSIDVKNAKEAVIYLSAHTNFDGIDKDEKEYAEPAISIVENKEFAAFDMILKAHLADMAEIYGRVKLDLGPTPTDKDIYERLKTFDGTDLGIYELLFGYGRYLSIASSREGSEASNLQGIWNERLDPPWSSNYTININAEMNYWHIFNTNLADCFKPFIEMAKKLQKTGRITAQKYYGARGFVSHHNTDLWGMSNPVGYKAGEDGCVYAFWCMSSGWVSCQLYDLYEYTLDKNLLKEIYPIMLEAALFYTDIMFTDENGKKYIMPSTSPENYYVRDGKLLSLSKSTTMTTSILRELFTRVLKAGEILGDTNETLDKVREMLPNIPLPQIGSDGRLMEWAYEEVENDKNHRHVSHLFSLYPGNLITKDKTPELAEACRQSLLTRGDNGTGWSLGWKINHWAMLGDGNHALELLKLQLHLVEEMDGRVACEGGGTFANMFDAHPPFQIDGNFGAAAAICNMLLQSEIGEISILPALPDIWEKGSVSGIKAKGNVTVDIKWENKKATQVVLMSPVTQKVTVLVNGEKMNIELEADKKKVVL